MNTNNYSNIEFINIDSFEHQWDQECMKNEPIFEIDCLDKFLLEKFESEPYSAHTDSFFSFENQTQMSYLSEPPCKMTEITPDSPASSRSTCLSPSEVTSEVPEKIFTCDFENCKKSFKFKWILDRHYLSHKSAKLFKCSFRGCTKSYKSKENLTLHFKNIHLNEKPYNCRYCSSVFSHRNGKTYHERKFHTNYLPHHCTLEGCGMNFASKSALTYHLKSQHSHKNLKKNFKIKSDKRSKFNNEAFKIINEFDDCMKN